jgi:hypothetical protein
MLVYVSMHLLLQVLRQHGGDNSKEASNQSKQGLELEKFIEFFQLGERSRHECSLSGLFCPKSIAGTD